MRRKTQWDVKLPVKAVDRSELAAQCPGKNEAEDPRNRQPEVEKEIMIDRTVTLTTRVYLEETLSWPRDKSTPERRTRRELLLPMNEH